MFGAFHDEVLSGFEDTIVKIDVMSCQEPPVEISRWYPASIISPSYSVSASPQYEPSESLIAGI